MKSTELIPFRFLNLSPRVLTKFKYIVWLLIIVLYQLNSFAQQGQVDSLLSLLKGNIQDTSKVNIYNKLFFEYEFSDNSKALEYINKALELSKAIDYKKGLAASYLCAGYLAEDMGNYREALNNYNSALSIAIEIREKLLLAKAYNNIGNVFWRQGNYPEALSNGLKALEISETVGNKRGVAVCYQFLGNIYSSYGNHAEALKNYFFALDVFQKIGDKGGIAYSYNNIAVIYNSQGNYDEALKYCNSALELHELSMNKPGVALVYQNIARNYLGKKNYSEALNFLFASLKIREELGDKSGIVECYFNIAVNLFHQNKYKESQKYLVNTLKLAKEIGLKLYLFEANKLLALVESKLGDFKNAYIHDTLSLRYLDSIDNEKGREKFIEAQMNFEFEKKQAATKAEQDKKDIIAKEELKQKEQQRNYFIAGFILIAVLALFILRGYQQKKQANFIISQQKNEVEKAKQVIEEKNKDITDSINYAQRIQHAMLPNLEDISAVYPDSFVLYKPKDIVSGDFYFFYAQKHTSYLAVADCTGHGVPGAFMSLIGSDKLQDAVLKSSDASGILTELNKGVKRALKQTDSTDSTRDGMDIALCVTDKEKHTLSYAGANRPLWIIRKGKREVEEIKATKCAIGGLTEDEQQFELNALQLAQGDTYYIATDGYADQFNGKTEKKLMSKRLKEILVDIQHLSMVEQKKYLDDFIEDWKAGSEQVDDILIIGVRV